MEKTERQKEAMRLTKDYTDYLLHQERMMERMLDRKLVELEPKIDLLIEKRLNMMMNKSNH
jgi:hypothetical protein